MKVRTKRGLGRLGLPAVLIVLAGAGCQATNTPTSLPTPSDARSQVATTSASATNAPMPRITTQTFGEGVSGGSTATIAWPKVTGLTFEADQPIQAAIDSMLQARLDAFETQTSTAVVKLTGTLETPYAGTDFLSLRFTFVESGVDDGRPQVATLDFECSTGRRLDLRQMFRDQTAAVGVLSEESFRHISEQVAGQVPSAHGPDDPKSVFYPSWSNFSDWTIDPAGIRAGFAYRDVMWRDGTGYLFAVVPWSVLQATIDPSGPFGEFVSGPRQSVSAAPTVAPTPTQPPFPAATNLPASLRTAGADPGASWHGVTFAKAADYTETQVGLGSMFNKTPARWPGGWMISDDGMPSATSSPSVAFLSADGETWQALPVPGPCYPSPQGIVSYNAAGNVWTSPDGHSWTFHVTTGPTGNVIAAGSGGLLAVVQNSGVAYSRDGISWQIVSLPTLGGYGIAPLSAAWTGSRFIMTGVSGGSDHNVVLWSADGFNWTVAQTPVSPGEASFMIGRDGVLLVDPWFAPRVMLWSSDGVAWQDVSRLIPGAKDSKTELDFFANGVRMLARAADGRMWTSFDGRTWTKLAGSAPLSTGSDNVRGGVTLMPRGIFLDDWKHGYLAYGAAE